MCTRSRCSHLKKWEPRFSDSAVVSYLEGYMTCDRRNLSVSTSCTRWTICFLSCLPSRRWRSLKSVKVDAKATADAARRALVLSPKITTQRRRRTRVVRASTFTDRRPHPRHSRSPLAPLFGAATTSTPNSAEAAAAATSEADVSRPDGELPSQAEADQPKGGGCASRQDRREQPPRMAIKLGEVSSHYGAC